MERKVFLSNVELGEAMKKYFQGLDISSRITEMETWNACGMTTSDAVYAKISSPFYNSSAMDGIAVKSKDTEGANERKHITLIEGKDYLVVDTGDPIPKGYDAVIMVEDLIHLDEGAVEIYKSIAPWQNVRVLGEDIVEGSLIVPSNHKIRPVDIGAMVAGGVNKVNVYSKPKIGVIPTGTELVEPGKELQVGDIIEFNSRTFCAQINQWNGEAVRKDIVEDDYKKIKEKIESTIEECDMVIVNAGSSAGREDYTAKIIEELGEVVLHGIAIKPGKPVILGKIKNKPLVGIPGYPVSAYFIMEIIVKELVERFQGNHSPKRVEKTAVLSRRIMSSLKHLEFIRMKLGYVGNRLIATPLTRGAGATMSLVRADGIFEVPQNIEGVETGENIKVRLLKGEEEIKNTVVCIGSHDPILDIMADMIHIKTKDISLSSAHVGSMGGIMALRRGEAHAAPIHLLDLRTGEYNKSYINRYLKDKDVCVVKLVKRIQGLMVPEGNPKNIKSIRDLVEKDLTFVNRQRGAGTRILLDYMLIQEEISSEDIRGYEREEMTHLSVAAAVKAGDVDCGLGVFSAAKMMGLDFIPICNEDYDLAVPEEYIEEHMIQELIGIIKSEEFKKKLDELGGYNYSESGEILRVR